VDNTLLDLQNSSYPTQPHSIIAKHFIDTPLVGLFSDNATNKDIPIRINYTINIITTYYTKGALKLNYD